MNLDLFERLKKDIEANVTMKNFMEELSVFLNNINSSKTQNNRKDVSNENEIKTNGKNQDDEKALEDNERLQKYRKEGHLYLVTEDRNNEIYLWDFTDKSKHEFKETIYSDELLSVAKEGAMLQYKNGKYELYSPYGYDMLSNKEKINTNKKSDKE